MKTICIVMALSLAFLTGISGAEADSENPFGFETHTHPLEYKFCKKEHGLFREHGYKCNSAPRPHPDLQEYKLQFVEQVGLCFIEASNQPDYWYTMVTMGEALERNKKQILNLKYYSTPTIEAQIARFLEDIGIVPSFETSPQLADILKTYIWLNPSYVRRYDSGDTAVLTEAFNEMKKNWFRAGQADVLLEWTSNLKRLIEKNVQSDSSNKFEMFNRQITKKYGPATTPERVQDEHNGGSSVGIIGQIRGELRARYRRGYFWVPEKGFEGLGDIKAIQLILIPSPPKELQDKVAIYFWLVTSDACREKLDEKGDQAF